MGGIKAKLGIVRFKSRRLMIVALLMVAFLGGGLAAALTSSSKPEQQITEVKDASTQRDSKVSAKATKTANNAADNTTSSTNSASVQPVTSSVTKTSTPSKTSTTSTTPPPALTAGSVNLDLGTLTFDNYTNSPVITFDLPITADASVPVTMTVIRQSDGTVLCVRTITVVANEDTDFQCSYTPIEAPNGVNATVTAGTNSVQSSNVYDGYFPP